METKSPEKQSSLPLDWGTRFLQATKAHGHETLPIVDKPTIQAYR